MLEEAVASLNIKPDGFYVDATFGRGGHAVEILQRLSPKGQLLLMDRDPTAIKAAILAIGYPVAFEARAEDLDTLGFTSITLYWPVDCSTANCTLHPPFMLSLRINFSAASLNIW